MQFQSLGPRKDIALCPLLVFFQTFIQTFFILPQLGFSKCIRFDSAGANERKGKGEAEKEKADFAEEGTLYSIYVYLAD